MPKLVKLSLAGTVFSLSLISNADPGTSFPFGHFNPEEVLLKSLCTVSLAWQSSMQIGCVSISALVPHCLA